MSNKAVSDLDKSPGAARKGSKEAGSAAQQVDAAAASASAGDQWSVENKVLLLQTFLRISEDRGAKPSYEQIHEAMQGSIPDDYSKDKVGNKLRDLKRKFLSAQSRSSPPREDLLYQLSEKIWGGAADAEIAATPKVSTSQAKLAHKRAADAEVVVSPKAKLAPKRAADVEVAVSRKAKPTPKRKKEKPPVISAHPVATEEGTERPRKSPPKRKAKKAPEIAAAHVPPEEEEEAVVAEDAAARPPKSPRGQNITPTPRLKKEKTKSKRLELVATGRSPGDLQKEDDGRMLPGLVRILQQVYPEAAEKAVLSVLESMDGPRVEEIKKNWYALQAVKLEVAHVTANLAILLTQALQ